MEISTTTPTDSAAPTPAAEIRRLNSAAAAHDGIEPFSEQFLLGLDDGGERGHRHVIARTGNGDLVGAAASDGSTAELMVEPGHRRRGVGTALYRVLVNGAGVDTVWAHGNLPPAVGWCRSRGLEPVRELLVMGVGGRDLAAAAGAVEREGFHVMDLDRSRRVYGADHVDGEWLRVNNEAFSWHPEQGGWDADRLARGQDTDWFDPEGVLLFWSGADGSGDGGPAPELAGFHWTKWHGGDGTGTSVGEVYVVGLADGFRGRGLGGPLISSGLHHLADRGADEVILYVEADNTAAVAAYERLGFGVRERHVAYGSPE
ncbi:mycothiol synthase [Corynebacterium sp. CCM 8835]|uniref:Mycothiol acetyltransferase n=1 Tax=Corynebacterium antarcticum TaxID=2800405 RepID=A0ABS1FJ62_9CORY|nr:mycothiol synthase [Corynebacterium antarcticum]MCK7661941.1 mycothiol synthase [Corynebacterium antarcticum]MCL0246402.1 mycothiol synthase [Corynebacterium antarcticum]MCX7492542.1 mycothiol synthase [Corynebacterium antarcticum]